MAQFQFVAFDDGQDDLFLPAPSLYEFMRLHFIGQGVIEQNGMCLPESRVILQLAKQAGRPLRKLPDRIQLFLLADRFAQLFFLFPDHVFLSLR